MAEFRGLMLWTDAYLADTGHLGDCEHGRYLMLLMQMWRAPNRRFPNDDAWLARKFRRSVEAVQSELRPILAEFFKTDGNWLFHKRLDEEWKRSCATSAKQSAAAKSRWNKEKDVCHGNPSGLERKDKKDKTQKEKEIPVGISKEKTLPQLVQSEPRGSRIPADWQPSEADVAFALNQGMTHDDIGRESPRFHDYWLGAAGQRARKSDWPACWRTWVRNACERNRPASSRASFNGGGNGNGRANGRPAGRVAETVEWLHRRGALGGH